MTVSKVFTPILLDLKQCRREVDAFGALLRRNHSLSEKADIQPFFRRRKQLSAFIGSWLPAIAPVTEYAFEYPFYGDFAADLVVGYKAGGRFCVIEFEDGRPDSIFQKRGRSTTEWSPRFEHGFSQIVDWFTLLDDVKKTDRFKRDFGHGHIRFSAMLIIGREAGLTDFDRDRLRWRTEKVRVDSHNVECVTFDALHEDMDRRLKYHNA